MKIVSDFRDYYDYAASGDGPVLTRLAGGRSMSKRDQFRLLEDAGFLVPMHGTVCDVLESWWDVERTRVKAVVAYTDEFAHCGEGKEVWWKQCPALNIQPRMGYDTGNERAYQNFGVYCSAFVGNPHAGRGESIRRLQIGRHVFWIEYKSNESWMSNVGDGEITVVGAEKDAGYHPRIRLPLWAVDFVVGRELYAVDFNTAPGCRWTGVEKYLPAAEAVESLERAIRDLSLPD